MNSSLFLARLLGPFIVLISISLLINLKTYRQIVEGFLENTALIYVTGLITFVAGLAIVIFHNLWVVDWRVIITVFGWITLIKGVWLTVFPANAVKISKVFVKNIKFVAIPWIVMFALGLFLVMQGYLPQPRIHAPAMQM
ncbi:MAG: hypothetical protein M0R48_05200 [Candidatus Omnitrophica bacterium]|jgi:uncharacterized membrane protein|nr:hypothetical protein [Candidatus Omnitrophota bacterium]